MDPIIKSYYTTFLQAMSEKPATVYAISVNCMDWCLMNKFDQLSKMMQIGVYAPHGYANALLFIFRVLLDKNYHLLETIVDSHEADQYSTEYEPLTSYENFVVALMRQETEFLLTAPEIDQLKLSIYQNIVISPNFSSSFLTAFDLANELSKI